MTKPLGNSGVVQIPGLTYPPIVMTSLPANTSGRLSSHILGLVRIPRGFLEDAFADGIAAIYKVGGAQIDQFGNPNDTYQLGFHRPGSSAANFILGWHRLDAPQAGPVDSAVVGAQRRGEWIYTIAAGTASSGSFRRQVIERSNSIRSRERRTSDESLLLDGLGSGAAGAAANSFLAAVNQDLFVSDRVDPELFYLSGFTVGKTTDRDGTPMAWHYVTQDNRGFGGGDTSAPFYPRHSFRYEFWHTYQNYEGTGPASTQLPALVHPWSAGDYRPPEMWFFVPEVTQSSTHTGRLKIYRSQYRAGQYRYGLGFSHLAPLYQDYQTGSETFGATPSGMVGQPVIGSITSDDADLYNPDGFAFDPDWYNEKNYIGSVGPFRAAIFSGSRDSSNGSNRVLRVVRDRRREGLLHLVMFQQTSVFNDISGAWDGAWFASSNDDGATWGRTRQMNPFVTPRPDWDPGPFVGSPSLVVTGSGDLLSNASASYVGTAIQSMVNINWVGGAQVAGTKKKPVIFRMGSGGA